MSVYPSLYSGLLSGQLFVAVEYTDCASAGVIALPLNEYPWYDTKQYDGEGPALELWESLFIAIAPRSTGVVALDRVLSMGQIELFDMNCRQPKDLCLNEFLDYWTVWSFDCVKPCNWC